MFIEHVLCSRPCFRSLRYVSEQNEDSYPQRAFSIIKGEDKKTVNITNKLLYNNLIMLIITEICIKVIGVKSEL